MNADPRASPEKMAELRLSFEDFRLMCFAQYPGSDLWVWASADRFTFYPVALAVMHTGGFDIEVNAQTLIIHAFGARHAVPITQLSDDSLQHVQGLLRGAQRTATNVLMQTVHDAYGVGSFGSEAGAPVLH